MSPTRRQISRERLRRACGQTASIALHSPIPFRRDVFPICREPQSHAAGSDGIVDVWVREQLSGVGAAGGGSHVHGALRVRGRGSGQQLSGMWLAVSCLVCGWA
eukprot:786662-Rhodomonas_salina.1